MSTIKDAALFKEIKQGTFQTAYYLYGEETYFIERAQRLLAEKVVDPELAFFNSVTLLGDKPDITALEEAVEGLPMMARQKYILVKDWDVEKLPKDEFDRLCNVLDDLPDTVVLAVVQQSPIETKKTGRAKKVIDIIGRNGVVCEFVAKDKPTLKRALCERAQKAGVGLDMDIAEQIVDRCGTDYGRLVNELDKLVAYSRGMELSEITSGAVNLCCILSIEATSFELAKLLLSRRFDEGYTKLCDLLFLRQEGVAIVSALGMAFLDIYRASCAVEAGVSQDRVLDDFGYAKNRAFAVKNAFRDIRSISPKQISTCINALYEADLLLKSSKMENKVILEQMVLKMKI